MFYAVLWGKSTEYTRTSLVWEQMGASPSALIVSVGGEWQDAVLLSLLV